MERQSNIELLRIIAMFSIVIGHFILQTDSICMLNGINQFLAIFLSSARRISVAIFLMIGCWFMVDSKFKPARVLNLYFQLLFYTLSIRIILLLFNAKISLHESLNLIFPFITFSLWFVSAYIWLILFSPFLQNILLWKRENIKKLLIIMFILIFGFSMIFINMDTLLCVIFSFIFYYLGIGYYKKYLHGNININKYFMLIGAMTIYLGLVILKFFCITNNIEFILKILNSYIRDYHCAINLCISFPVFYYFINTKFKTSKFINYISSATLTVYIVHQSPGFIKYLWYNIYYFEKFIHSKYYFLLIIFIPVSLYFICILLEVFRKKFIEPIIQKTFIYKWSLKHIENFYFGLKCK